MTRISTVELTDLCEQAALRAGADTASARSLADATVQSERVGNRAVGVGHLFDYLDGYREGRISNAAPEVRRPGGAVFAVDAREGLAQESFQTVREDLVATAKDLGIAALWVSNSFTCGELGYYPRAVASEGLIGFAAANSPALMSIGGSPSRLLGTNPLAYGFPRPGTLPAVIDQASSATAFVNIRRAADTGQDIPAGWALNSSGEPTQDPAEAIEGTLLPFGSHRGGNIALLIEILATLAGGNFSVDAPAFDSGDQSPGIGVFLLCIDPEKFGGSVERLSSQLGLLRDEHGVRLPALELTELPDEVEIADDLLARLRAAA
ncbi:MAG: Ldh family oxidoreductase [Leucobacter sp.]